MNWKEWPSWLKGGVIGLIIGLIGYFLKYSIFGRIIGIIPATFLSPLFLKSGMQYSSLFGAVIAPIFYLVAGVLIGWLIGLIISKIKFRNKIQ